IRPGDSVLCFNFRPDRMREIVRALAEPGFGAPGAEAEGAEADSLVSTNGPGQADELPGWQGRRDAPPVSRLATLTEYEEGWPYPVAFAPARPQTTLSRVIAHAGLRQLHVA